MGRLSNIDPNSYSQPEKVILKHVDLNWNVDFEKQIITGSADLKFAIVADEIEEILLDVSEIKIASIFLKVAAGEIPLSFEISDTVPDIGSKLTIFLPNKTSGEILLVIDYDTAPSASALQWLTPEQTLGKKHPYMFSQCQAIHARSIIPVQDTPSVKFSYTATVKHPKALTALMSAIRTVVDEETTKFEQTVPIPAYLLAIAIGALTSRKIGPISSVWAEEEQIDAAANEFTDTDSFVEKASEICGPYVWKQYDLIVMPPSFPFGGMENPCLTFVTPTLIAGDRSLADVVAHEISHSWTGNLVTNKNFEHFWLNEGFTVFVEGKIIGRLHGDAYRDFHALQNLSDLRDCINNQLKDQPELTKLVVDLSNLSPDDAFSSVPYVKGSTFLRYLEDLLGGPTIFEPFFRSYLNEFKYKSVVTDDFKKALYNYFNESQASNLAKVDWDLWLFGTGMPPIIPNFDQTIAQQCLKHCELWANNATVDIEKSPIIQEKLTSTQCIEFLSQLLNKSEIVDLTESKIALLAKVYGLENTFNAEIRFRYMRLLIRTRIFEKLDEIIAFANSNFRMKYVRPVYRDLGNWPEAKPFAIENFNKVKDQMMKVCANQVAKDLGL